MTIILYEKISCLPHKNQLVDIINQLLPDPGPAIANTSILSTIVGLMWVSTKSSLLPSLTCLSTSLPGERQLSLGHRQTLESCMISSSLTLAYTLHTLPGRGDTFLLGVQGGADVLLQQVSQENVEMITVSTDLWQELVTVAHKVSQG